MFSLSICTQIFILLLIGGNFSAGVIEKTQNNVLGIVHTGLFLKKIGSVFQIYFNFC